MNIFWKGAAALLIVGSAMSAAVVPAQAHERDRYDRRGDRYDRHDRWDRDDRRREWRRYQHRSDWRGNDWRGNDRRRCWTEWRYDRYRDRDVRVRICR